MKDGFYTIHLYDFPYQFEIRGGKLYLLRDDGRGTNTGIFHPFSRMSAPDCGVDIQDRGTVDDLFVMAVIEAKHGNQTNEPNH